MSRALPEWVIVARREFLERVRTVWFVIVTLLGPIGMAAVIIIPAWLSVKSAPEEIDIEIVDDSGADLIAQIHDVVGAASMVLKIEDAKGATDTELMEKIRVEEIDGFLKIPADALDGGTIVYSGANATNPMVIKILDHIVTAAVQRARAGDDVPRALLDHIVADVPFESRHTTGTAEAVSSQATFFIGYAVMLILYMAILLYAVNVLRSVVQEKTSRVVEILVSAVKPRSLMFGKIIGVGCVGLFQLSIWGAIAVLLVRYREQVLGLFGVHGAGAFSIPSLDGVAIVVVLAYFLLGYFFYSSIYAAIGAMVNSDQEAQQAQTPVVLLLIIPVVCVQLVANDPRGGIAEVLTMIPFSSPVLMPMRYLLGGASGGQVLLSMAILIASTACAVFFAARIYRVGILMYGKRPSLRELARWIRYK